MCHDRIVSGDLRNHRQTDGQMDKCNVSKVNNVVYYNTGIS